MFARYASRNGVFDEAIQSGQVRPHWRPFVENLQEIGEPELQRRWEQAQRQITKDGFSFNPHDPTGETSRPWILDALPLLITESEWQQLAAGLDQRAQLFDLILRDLFGPQHLIRERVLPPYVLYGHPGFGPAYHGLTPPGKHHLHLYAADLARSPEGTWWVTGDRTRAPFGLGYALENRIITSRMLPTAFHQCRVQRLASFFIALREKLREMAPRFRENPRIVLWTQGPSSWAYFEDAYLARYLGYTLVEGGDLAVRGNRVMLKTLGGLLPVEVLLRRLDDDDCDPVELSPDSTFGVPGLLEVLRSNNVSVANSLGSWLVESPILLAFLPLVCRRLLGEDLRLPSVATWWCGEESALQHVVAHFDQILLRPAFRTTPEPPIQPANLSKKARRQCLETLRTWPSEYVAQEIVERSTTPVWTEGGPEAWSLALRAFLVAKEHGYLALPGGLARVSREAAVLDHPMTSGERSLDVWILSDGPVEEVSLLSPPGQQVSLRRSGAELPSRVADNLFWLGRNVERAESAARLLRTVFLLFTSEREQAPELSTLLKVLAELGQIEPDHVVAGLQDTVPDIRNVLPEAVFDTKHLRSLRSTILEAVRLASMVRDRIAVDAWRLILRIVETSRRPAHGRTIEATEVLTILDQVITELVALAGLAGESMTRTQGWRFLDLGRRIERALQTVLLLQSTLASADAEEPAILEAILQTADSIMTYRSRYLATVQPAPVLDLLRVDETNPRSIAYQLAVIADHVDQLPRDAQEAVRGPEQRLALSLQSSVRMADVYKLCRSAHSGKRAALLRLLSRLADQLPKLSDAVSDRFLIHAGFQQHFAGSAGEAQ